MRERSQRKASSCARFLKFIYVWKLASDLADIVALDRNLFPGTR